MRPPEFARSWGLRPRVSHRRANILADLGVRAPRTLTHAALPVSQVETQRNATREHTINGGVVGSKPPVGTAGATCVLLNAPLRLGVPITIGGAPITLSKFVRSGLTVSMHAW